MGYYSAATLFLLHWNAMAEVDAVRPGEEMHTALYSSIDLHILHLAVSKQAAGEKADGWPAKSETNSSFSSVNLKAQLWFGWWYPWISRSYTAFLAISIHPDPSKRSGDELLLVIWELSWRLTL